MVVLALVVEAVVLKVSPVVNVHGCRPWHVVRDGVKGEDRFRKAVASLRRTR